MAKTPEPNPPPARVPFQAPLDPEQRQQLLDQVLDQMLIQTLQLQIGLAAEIDSPFTVPQRINAGKAVATIVAVYVKLRAMSKDDEQPGSAIRKFETAFKTAHAARRGAADGGSDELELEDHLAELERDDSEGDDAR